MFPVFAEHGLVWFCIACCGIVVSYANNDEHDGADNSDDRDDGWHCDVVETIMNNDNEVCSVPRSHSIHA